MFFRATSGTIGTSSGYYHIPFTFSVPVLFTNSPRFEEYYGLRKNDLYLPRMMKIKDHLKLLKMNEFMSTPLGIYNNKECYQKEKLQVIPNNSDEILEATKEIYQNLNQNYLVSESKNLLKMQQNQINI